VLAFLLSTAGRSSTADASAGGASAGADSGDGGPVSSAVDGSGGYVTPAVGFIRRVLWCDLPLISENGGISFPAEKVFDPNVGLISPLDDVILCVCLGIEGTTTNVGNKWSYPPPESQLGRTCTQGCCARNNRHSLHPQDLRIWIDPTAQPWHVVPKTVVVRTQLSHRVLYRVTITLRRFQGVPHTLIRCATNGCILHTILFATGHQAQCSKTRSGWRADSV